MDSLYLASTLGLAAYTGFSSLDYRTFKESSLIGVVAGCALQVLGVANGRRGIADAANAPLLSNLLATLNVTVWLTCPYKESLSFALCSLAIKTTSVVFQRPCVNERRASLFLAATVGLALSTTYTAFDFKALRYAAAAGMLAGVGLHFLGMLNRGQGTDPKNAPRLTYLLATINLANWINQPREFWVFESAVFASALKITTLFFQKNTQDKIKRRYSV